MMKPLLLVTIIAVFGVAMFVTDVYGEEEVPDPARVMEIAEMLPEAPEGLGRPITDRDAWDALAETDAYARVINRAEGYLEDPLPDLPDDLYLDFSRTGNRVRWQRVSSNRRSRLPALVLAECAENEGRFIAAIEELIAALCEERTWVMPAHDRTLRNFNQEQIDIDLASSALGWHLTSTNWLLGDRLSEDTRELIRSKVEELVLEPFRAMYRGERDRNWWLTTTNNWNSVCLAGVTGAALAQIEDRELRAEYVAATEHYSRNFLRGFTPDGYCSEGLGYWNYGFGNYILLAETIYQATDGGLDLMARSEAAAPATYGARIQIIGGISPAFSDCSVTARPDRRSMYYVNRRFELGLDGYDDLALQHTTGDLAYALIYGFPNSASEDVTIERADIGSPLRSWFEDAGVLVSRPAPDGDAMLGVALKGGHNAEHHNHNDVGAYVAVVVDRAVLLDPGGETYTARTFSSERYVSDLLNSYGHPVPVVAGELQSTGREAAADVLSTDFAEERDEIVMDISAAYEVPGLTRLEREFIYDRTGAGSFTVADTVEFAEAQSFETALITDGDWERQEDGTLLIWDASRALEVEVDAGGAEWELVVDRIEEDARVQPTRLGIRLAGPVTEGSISTTMTPVPDFGLKGDSVLFNGDFELGGAGWRMPENSQGEISDEIVAAGRYSLRIVDDSEERGSNITSARMPVDGAGSWLWRGRVYHVSGSGIGMYVRFYDATGSNITPMDERGWISPIGSLEGEVGEWAAFELPFETPEDAASMELWIHSFNAALVVAHLDDMEVVPAD